MKMRHPGAKLTDTLLPYTTLCRSGAEIDETSGDHDFVPLGCLRRERIVHDMEDTAAVEQIARQDAVLPIWLLDRKDREDGCRQPCRDQRFQRRSEEHTSDLQSLMRISYAVFCLQNKKQHTHT